MNLLHLSSIQSDYLLSSYADPEIRMASKEKERTPFLRHMKWDEHLADIRMSEDKRNLILRLKAPARLDELGYYQLAKVVDDYITRGMDIGWNHNNHARVRKHLAQGAHLSPNMYESHKPLRLYNSNLPFPLASTITGNH